MLNSVYNNSFAVVFTMTALRLADDEGISNGRMNEFAQTAIANGGHAFWHHFHAYAEENCVTIEAMSEYEERKKGE